MGISRNEPSFSDGINSFPVPLQTSRPEIIVIGHITEKEKGCLLILEGGSEIEITAQGWNELNDQKDIY